MQIMQAIEVEIYNHQSIVAINDEVLAKFTEKANQALPMAQQSLANGGGVLNSLDLVEVSIVDDVTIAQVHVDFMDIAGATDVITFAHGEIVISAETALDYGERYCNTFEKELMLYIIHGLLHLAGHEDEVASERSAMEEIQFAILEKVWN